MKLFLCSSLLSESHILDLAEERVRYLVCPKFLQDRRKYCGNNQIIIHLLSHAPSCITNTKQVEKFFAFCKDETPDSSAYRNICLIPSFCDKKERLSNLNYHANSLIPFFSITQITIVRTDFEP